MTACPSCATELPDNAKFCLECGASVSAPHSPAEYQHVTVLFADVVRSMDIAAAVGAERLREIMAELVDCSTAVVKRYGGTANNSPAMASWRFSERQQRWKTMLYAHASPLSRSKGQRR